MDSKPLRMAKEQDHSNFFSVVNPEDHKEEKDNAFKKESTDTINASLATGASSDSPTDCYYCDHKFIEPGKSEYEKHVVNLHPGRPGYPGLADIEKYGIKP